MKRMIVVLLWLVAGCDRPPAPAASEPSAPSPPESSGAASTDPAAAANASFVSLVARPAGNRVRFRIIAPVDRPLFLENCNGAMSWGLEREAKGEWVPAWGAEIDGCHSAPIEIPAGTARDFDGVVTERPHAPRPPGPYRLAVYGLYFTHDDRDHAAGIEVPHDRRRSAPFTFGE